MSDETRERPGPIGRAVRSVAGVAMALVCLRVLTSYAALVDARGPGPPAKRRLIETPALR